MFNLEVLILSILISFSLQDSHCLITFEDCYKKEDGKEGSSSTGGIAHCVYAENGKCQSCEDGFAISYEKNSCISFQNCLSLEEGNKKCNQCRYYFHLNSEGKCERTLCQTYGAEDVCEECFPGYYLKNKQCQKITIPYCLALDSSDEKKCSSCIQPISMLKGGKCIVAPTLVKGCIEYDTEGECTKCEEEYTFNKGTCVFNSCSSGEIKYEYCGACEAGYYEDYDDLCVGYDGTKDKNAGSITGNQNTFILILLSLLI